MPNHVIIINFDFPPNYGIGGRRWAKIAKSFVIKGFKVSVIKAAPLDRRISQWHHEVKDLNINVHSFSRRAELNRFAIGISFLDSIGYKIALAKNKFRESGTPYDLAIGSQAEFNTILEKVLLETKAEWVFCTGAPFNLCYYAADYLRRKGGFKLWTDLRDPWLKAKNYGMSNLSKQRYSREVEKVKVVLDSSTFISAPSAQVLHQLIEACGESNADKLYVLKHFYDIDDHPKQIDHFSDEKIRIVYGGEIYHEGEIYLTEISKDLDHLKINAPDVYKNLDIIFYSGSSQKIAEIFKQHKIVKAADWIGDRIFAEIGKSDFCVIFLADHNKDFFTTKYYDFMPLHKPYLYIGPDGDIKREIEEQKLGLSWKSFVESVEMKSLNINEFKINPIELAKHSLDNRVDEIIRKTMLK